MSLLNMMNESVHCQSLYSGRVYITYKWRTFLTVAMSVAMLLNLILNTW